MSTLSVISRTSDSGSRPEAVDDHRHVEGERVHAERLEQSGVGSYPAIVTGHVEATGSALGVRLKRFKVQSGVMIARPGPGRHPGAGA